MRKLKVVLLTAALFVIAFGVQAQSTESGSGYKQAVGFVGHHEGGGISYKRFIKDTHALEGWLTISPLFTKATGTKLTGLYLIHLPAFDVPGLNWFYGGGAHIGAYGYDAISIEGATTVTESKTRAYVGVDAVGGMDYKLDGLPLNFSLIYNPSANLVPAVGFDFVNVKVAARYTF